MFHTVGWGHNKSPGKCVRCIKLSSVKWQARSGSSRLSAGDCTVIIRQASWGRSGHYTMSFRYIPWLLSAREPVRPPTICIGDFQLKWRAKSAGNDSADDGNYTYGVIRTRRLSRVVIVTLGHVHRYFTQLALRFQSRCLLTRFRNSSRAGTQPLAEYLHVYLHIKVIAHL